MAVEQVAVAGQGKVVLRNDGAAAVVECACMQLRAAFGTDDTAVGIPQGLRDMDGQAAGVTVLDQLAARVVERGASDGDGALAVEHATGVVEGGAGYIECIVSYHQTLRVVQCGGVE